MSKTHLSESSCTKHTTARTFFELIRNSLREDSLKKRVPHELIRIVLNALKKPG